MTISKRGTNGTKFGSLYDTSVRRTRRTLFRLVFALAMSLKVKPTQLAKLFDKEKTDEYAHKFAQELKKENRG